MGTGQGQEEKTRHVIRCRKCEEPHFADTACEWCNRDRMKLDPQCRGELLLWARIIAVDRIGFLRILGVDSGQLASIFSKMRW